MCEVTLWTYFWGIHSVWTAICTSLHSCKLQCLFALFILVIFGYWLSVCEFGFLYLFVWTVGPFLIGRNDESIRCTRLPYELKFWGIQLSDLPIYCCISVFRYMSVVHVLLFFNCLCMCMLLFDMLFATFHAVHNSQGVMFYISVCILDCKKTNFNFDRPCYLSTDAMRACTLGLSTAARRSVVTATRWALLSSYRSVLCVGFRWLSYWPWPS